MRGREVISPPPPLLSLLYYLGEGEEGVMFFSLSCLAAFPYACYGRILSLPSLSSLSPGTFCCLCLSSPPLCLRKGERREGGVLCLLSPLLSQSLSCPCILLSLYICDLPKHNMAGLASSGALMCTFYPLLFALLLTYYYHHAMPAILALPHTPAHCLST